MDRLALRNQKTSKKSQSVENLKKPKSLNRNLEGMIITYYESQQLASKSWNHVF